MARLNVSCILPQNALKRDRNSKCIDLIEGHYLKIVVLLYIFKRQGHHVRSQILIQHVAGMK